MFCGKCSQEVPGNSKVCQGCGATLGIQGGQKKKIGKGKIIAIVCGGMLLFGALGSGITGCNSEPASAPAQEPASATASQADAQPATTPKTVTHTANEVAFEFAKEVIFDTENGTVTINGTTNAPDGTILQFLLFTSLDDMTTFEPVVKDGSVSVIYDVPEPEIPKRYGLSVTLQFNADSIIQPDTTKEMFGQYGELMTGEGVTDAKMSTGEDAKHAAITYDDIYFPSEDSYNESLSEEFDGKIKELIEITQGVIIDIAPLDGKDWTLTGVIVSDSWYESKDYEKERFAVQLSETLTALIKNYAKSDQEFISVIIYDSFGKKLAEPKVFGGYEIKG